MKFIIILIFSIVALNYKLKLALISTVVIIPAYIFTVAVVFGATSYKFNILAVPIGVIVAFLIAVLIKYIDMQVNRMYEMRDMLFSMAEAIFL